MILWRPSNNSQRFAFSLLQDEDDEDDYDQEMETEIFGLLRFFCF